MFVKYPVSHEAQARLHAQKQLPHRTPVGAEGLGQTDPREHTQPEDNGAGEETAACP